MWKALTELLTYGGIAALFVFGLIIIDRAAMIPVWLGQICCRFLDWRDARRRPRGWQPGGFRMRGVTRY